MVFLAFLKGGFLAFLGVFHGFLGISQGIPGVPFRVLLIFQLQPQLNPIDSAGQNTSPPDQALRSADL